MNLEVGGDGGAGCGAYFAYAVTGLVVGEGGDGTSLLPFKKVF